MALRRSASRRGVLVGGRWSLEGALGVGGHATVWRVRDVARGTTGAMKRLTPPDDPADARELAGRIAREARLLAALDTLHAPRLLDAGARGEAAWFVMERVGGEDLRARLARQGPLPLGAAIDLATQAVAALVDLEAKGVVHRDLKPANLMLEPRPGGAPLVKLIDFGVGAMPRALGPRLTGARSMLGTPEYMAPEQIRGVPADPRSDQYALGVVLFEAVAGALPYEGEHPAATLAKVLSEPVPDLADAVPGCPPAFARLVARAMAKEPDARFADATAMARALDAVVAALGDAASTREAWSPSAPASVRPAGARRPAARARPRWPP